MRRNNDGSGRVVVDTVLLPKCEKVKKVKKVKKGKGLEHRRRLVRVSSNH